MEKTAKPVNVGTTGRDDRRVPRVLGHVAITRRLTDVVPIEASADAEFATIGQMVDRALVKTIMEGAFGAICEVRVELADEQAYELRQQIEVGGYY